MSGRIVNGIDVDTLPYRPCAGIMLLNAKGLVFAGQRLDNPGSPAWQMPQGGIDKGEDPESAALRELGEETGISSDKVDIVTRTRDELFYDLPDELIGKIWKGKWRGQRQIWFLMRFLGQDSDINIATDHAEFSRWKWADPMQLPDMIVPFKRQLYRDVLKEFTSHL
ncbi:RNA pyrophosphohydrolase [Alterisphingorhabdus coralli]|uniref:RNA pyrophosphohydrolase n=1 Tax=Alterisphingorhabdus coralli TaxID=3071408 RepID=A0AA97F784_9SPHN|nr:RNA pyrophosphohydrolase [Parasphingorhabdus sp. SCSIO 66989]WOE73810.1 RNA pyrophosphohydrolase [Parasphingorhabdus sp. SCSIO 66989]